MKPQKNKVTEKSSAAIEINHNWKENADGVFEVDSTDFQDDGDALREELFIPSRAGGKAWDAQKGPIGATNN